MVTEATDSHVSTNHLFALEIGVCSCSKHERKYSCIWKGVRLDFTGLCLFFKRYVSSNSDQSLGSNFTWVLR